MLIQITISGAADSTDASEILPSPDYMNLEERKASST